MIRDDESWLRRAIQLSKDARAAGNEPFGSLLLGADDSVLAVALNTVITDDDISAHPELKLAVWAAANLDPEAARTSTMYTSCENCAMCSAAMVRAGIGTLVFALGGRSLVELQGGPGSLSLTSREIFARSPYPVEVRGPSLEDEAAEAHVGFWSA